MSPRGTFWIFALVSRRGSCFGATLAWSEPLSALPRSARSRVSFTRSLWKAPAQDPLRLPSLASQQARVGRRIRRARAVSPRAVHADEPAPRCAVRRRDRVESPRPTAPPPIGDPDWEGGAGVLAGDLRERPRRPATEQSEGAQLGAPPERPLSPKRIPAPTDRAKDQIRVYRRDYSAAIIADATAVLSSSFGCAGNVSRRVNSRRSSNMLSAS